MKQLRLDQDGIVALLVVVTVMLEHLEMVLSTISLCFCGFLLYEASSDHTLFAHAANVPSPYLPMTPSSASYLPSTPGGQPMTPGTDLDVNSPDIGACLLLLVNENEISCLSCFLSNLFLPF